MEVSGDNAGHSCPRSCSGPSGDFDIPLLLAGSDFQKRVWQQLPRIPYGQTASYGELAAAIGSPRSVRAVANANGANAIEASGPSSIFSTWNIDNKTPHYGYTERHHGDMLLTDTHFKDNSGGCGSRNERHA